MRWIAVGVLVRAAALLVLFGLAALIAFALRRLIPAGRIRTALYRKRRLGEAPMMWVLLGWIAMLVGLIAWLGP